MAEKQTAFERPSTEHLARLEPLGELGGSFLNRLAAKIHVSEIEQGTNLRATDEHRWMVYLLQGQMKLVINDRSVIVAPASPYSQRPLFSVNRKSDHAEAKTPCVIARVERALFESLRNSQNTSNYEIIDTPLSGTETEIVSTLFSACMNGELAVPSMPEVALRLEQALTQNDVNINTLARIVQTDLAVTGGLMRAANSAMYGGSQPVRNIRDAIFRLGLDTTRKLAMSLAMRKLFNTDSPELKSRMRQLWAHSVEISALSYEIARLCSPFGFDPEEAMLAGLLHDVGTIPILDYLAQHDIRIEGDELGSLICKLKPFVGEIIASNWGLGDEFTTVLKESESWSRDHRPEPDYCDIVIVSQIYALSIGEKPDSVPHIDKIPAFEKLSLGHLDERARLELIESARDEIASVMEILGD